MVQAQGNQTAVQCLSHIARARVVVRCSLWPNGPSGRCFIGAFTLQDTYSGTMLWSVEYVADDIFHGWIKSGNMVLPARKDEQNALAQLLNGFEERAKTSRFVTDDEVVCVRISPGLSVSGGTDIKPNLIFFLHLLQVMTALQMRTISTGDRLLEERIGGYLEQNFKPFLEMLA